MGLLTRVPNYPANEDMPFLRQVQFDDYAKLLAAVSAGMGVNESAGPAKAGADAKPSAPGNILTRYVGFSVQLTELHTVLASAGVNSMWIRGEPGTGKTALVEEFVRVSLSTQSDGFSAVFDHGI